ncbi:LOW QUALITY PROTEIN: hypothetical protein PanWU01x14_328550 [Parasponia andersonii]|uniref:Uncharacterized protein n=1 Tax=Parasponia andersonii TaxID=3476 RepID=A0A2P5AIN1_PARAD|nr:LOW QUALITY PROTEIN: hypothetical protein PanWU01x14_328550 [Parasponia andersonii]
MASHPKPFLASQVIIMSQDVKFCSGILLNTKNASSIEPHLEYISMILLYVLTSREDCDLKISSTTLASPSALASPQTCIKSIYRGKST